jgi:uncharacterized protein YcaQ
MDVMIKMNTLHSLEKGQVQEMSEKVEGVYSEEEEVTVGRAACFLHEGQHMGGWGSASSGRKRRRLLRRSDGPGGKLRLVVLDCRLHCVLSQPI